MKLSILVPIFSLLSSALVHASTIDSTYNVDGKTGGFRATTPGQVTASPTNMQLKSQATPPCIASGDTYTPMTPADLDAFVTNQANACSNTTASASKPTCFVQLKAREKAFTTDNILQCPPEYTKIFSFGTNVASADNSAITMSYGIHTDLSVQTMDSLNDYLAATYTDPETGEDRPLYTCTNSPGYGTGGWAWSIANVEYQIPTRWNDPYPVHTTTGGQAGSSVYSGRLCGRSSSGAVGDSLIWTGPNDRTLIPATWLEGASNPNRMRLFPLSYSPNKPLYIVRFSDAAYLGPVCMATSSAYIANFRVFADVSQIMCKSNKALFYSNATAAAAPEYMTYTPTISNYSPSIAICTRVNKVWKAADTNAEQITACPPN